MKKILILFCAVAVEVLFIVGMAQAEIVGPITFATAADYDNTANTVVAGPTPVNHQTTGKFRDVIWWSINNGQPRVGCPDFINRGQDLVLVGNSAVDNGTGLYTAMNFTGPAISGGQSYLSIYDTTPGDGVATRNVFPSSAQPITISADVSFVTHSASGGVVALYNQGQDALALLAHNGGGNNPDDARLDLVWQSGGQGQVLQSVALPYSAFAINDWYRITMDLVVSGDTYTVNGTFQRHDTSTNPNSGLDGVIATLSKTGSLSGANLTNPGEVGIIAMGNEAIALPDNVGISVTNFQVVPEPATLCLLGLGVLGLLKKRRA
jgi:hypothetical protein